VNRTSVIMGIKKDLKELLTNLGEEWPGTRPRDSS
jgi:hypothetical protein